MEQEELDFLVALGKEQFLRNISLAMIQRFMPQAIDDQVLAQMKPEDMGHA